MVKYTIIAILIIFAAMLSAQPASAKGEFKFDFAVKVAGAENYMKHWSNTYPPDPKAEIIIYSYAGNVSYMRMTALRFVYVTYDPLGNVVAVDYKDTFNRSYDPVAVYYTLHPKSNWLEGNYKVKVIVYDRIDREVLEENINSDPFGIAFDIEKYKKFYETGENAKDMGIIRELAFPVAQATLNFRIDRKVTLYPPDRFLLHDVRFVDNSTERILGEKLKIEVKIDNNYKDEGTVRLAMLVDNTLVSTQDITVKGLSTSTVIFDAKAGKLGTFKLHFGADTPDLKYRNAELMFSIKNETDADKLDLPKITITGMNVNKEFVSLGENVAVLVTLVNNGKTGSKGITVYSNKAPVGSSEVQLQYLEEKTVEVPVTLETMGINKITVSDAPQLFRNVFVQESEVSALQENPVMRRVKESPLKVSMVVVFLVFAGMLYYARKRLFEDEFKKPGAIEHEKTDKDEPGNIITANAMEPDMAEKIRLSYMRKNLANKVQRMRKNLREKAAE